MQGNVSKICRTVTTFLGSIAQDIGKTEGFVRRRSKITAERFATMLIVGSYLGVITLERLCQLLGNQVSLTKQGLDERFTPHATRFMRQLFTEALRRFRGEQLSGIDLLKLFADVYLLDSSGISLPETLKDVYQGFGGDASASGVKLQTLLNYTQGHLEEIILTDGRKNDQSYRGHLSTLVTGALYLQDLGYFSVDSFQQIQEAGAYFVSKYLPQTKLYTRMGEPLELIKTLEHAEGLVALEVKLGKKTQLPLRLIAERLPREEVNQRLEQIRKEAAKRGGEASTELLSLAGWSIYVTNVDKALLADEHIHKVYSLRWQIELFFKLCKSEAGIDKITSQNPDRVQCELYAKLIGVVLLLSFCQPIRWQEKQEISWRKAYKQLQQQAITFFAALRSVYRLERFMTQFLKDLKNFALKDRHKKKRPATYQKLMFLTGQEVLL